MDTSGGDADLCPEAEFAAVAELRRGVPQCHRAVDALEEVLRGGSILGDDRVGMLGAVARDMRQRRIDAIDHRHRQDRIQPFGVEVGFAGSGKVRHDVTCCESARKSQPSARRSAMIGGNNAGAITRSISKVSVAPQMPVRRIFAFATMLRAIAGSADAWT